MAVCWKLFKLYGESITAAGAVPLIDMLAPNTTAIRLTAAHNYATTAPTVAAALHLRTEVVDDAWQKVAILWLATQLIAQIS